MTQGEERGSLIVGSANKVMETGSAGDNKSKHLQVPAMGQALCGKFTLVTCIILTSTIYPLPPPYEIGRETIPREKIMNLAR